MSASRIIDLFEHRSRPFWIATGVTSIGLLGIVDYRTGYEINFSLFYLAPIAAVSWFMGRRLGWVMSILSTITWLTAEIAAGQKYSHSIIYLWNTLIRFSFFILVTYLIAELRSAHDIQRALARTDYVSGAVNARHFNELVELEIARSRRYQSPLTLAYIDLDDFKLVNDNFGHDTGDVVIRFVANELKARLRTTDVVARMGGDEFVLLLPATGQSEAQAVILRLHTDLTQQMRENNWPVTLSMGVVICETAPLSAQELIQIADETMYVVKKYTKNAVRFLTYTGTPLKSDQHRPLA